MTGIPAIPDALVPSHVEDRDTYRAALGFESMLLGRLSNGLAESAGIADGPYAGAVSDAFAQSLLGAGGLGLAEPLYRAMKGIGT